MSRLITKLIYYTMVTLLILSLIVTIEILDQAEVLLVINALGLNQKLTLLTLPKKKLVVTIIASIVALY